MHFSNLICDIFIVKASALHKKNFGFNKNYWHLLEIKKLLEVINIVFL